MKTREIVMTEFEGILSQASTGRGRVHTGVHCGYFLSHTHTLTGGGLSQKGFEVLKSCASPYLLEPPATKIAMATEMITGRGRVHTGVHLPFSQSLKIIWSSLRYPNLKTLFCS